MGCPVASVIRGVGKELCGDRTPPASHLGCIAPPKFTAPNCWPSACLSSNDKRGRRKEAIGRCVIRVEGVTIWFYFAGTDPKATRKEKNQGGALGHTLP